MPDAYSTIWTPSNLIQTNPKQPLFTGYRPSESHRWVELEATDCWPLLTDRGVVPIVFMIDKIKFNLAPTS